MFTRYFSFAQCILVLMLLMLVGCGRSENIPTAPGPVDSSPDVSASTPVEPGAQAEPSEGYRLVWGFYDVEIDPESGEIEIVPVRHAALTLNVTQYLQAPLGNPADLGITIHDATQFQTNGRIDVDVSITHPFPLLQNLSGFDVMGVFMGDGSLSGFQDSTVTYTAGAPSEPILLNADGYTRWMNATEFTQTGLLGYTEGAKGIPGFVPSSTINGYKYYSEFLGVNEDLATFFQTPLHVTARGAFAAGSTLTRRFEISFPMVGGSPYLRFQYAILANWAAPDPASLPNPGVNDFPPAANLQEAIHMSVVDNGTDLYYASLINLGGTLRLQIEYFDWQGASNPGGFPAELSHLWIEGAGVGVVPGVYYDALPGASVSSGSGNSAVFTVTVPGCTPLASGSLEFLIMAESANPTDYDNGLGAPYPAGAPLAAFTRYTATVLACPKPNVTNVSPNAISLNSVQSALSIIGTDFVSGPSLAAEFRRSSGNVVGTNVMLNSSTSAEADFDFNGFSAGMYDLYFKNGCGIDASLLTNALEVNTQPSVSTPSGPAPVWITDNFVYSVVATELDPGQILTYTWSLEAQGNPANYVIAGDPTPGDVTINFPTMPAVTGQGFYELDCLVDDNSGAPNATTTCPTPLTIYVANPPYSDPIPPSMFNQVVCLSIPMAQGFIACPSFWDGFYQPGAPFMHPDICVLSGPSLGMPGVMVLADEISALVTIPPPPPVVMGFVHYQCPYTSGAMPSWWWWTSGQFPIGLGMAPSAVHFDGNNQAEFLVTNAMMTGALGAWGVSDPSAFEHYALAGVGKANDLYTSLSNVIPSVSPDVAVDATAGFDMGSPSSPDIPPLYGLFTQDQSGILQSCGGPTPGALLANCVHILQFPSGGTQPLGTAVDVGGPGIVAPITAGMVGPGPGAFSLLPGGPSPGGAIPYPEPYYALAIDDDPSDNPYPSGLTQPVVQWVIAAIIDGDRDLEVYEMDYGVAPPGPAPLAPLAAVPMGSFAGGNPNVYPLDCEFISNFSGFGGTLKPVWPEDLIAVLVTDPIAGVWMVEIFQIQPGAPVSVSMSMPVPTPPSVFNVPGIAYRLDVDEVTGDIYVVHEDTVGSGSMTVTMIPY